MINMKRFAAFGVTALILCPGSASAQSIDGLTQTVIALQAYEKSADRCFYEPIVGRTLDRLREHYSETEPRRWQREVREGRDANEMLNNMVDLALQGSPYTADPRISGPPKPMVPAADRGCVGPGLAVGMALPFAGPLIGFDPVLFAEANRLMEGKGRARADTSGSRSEKLSPAPNAPR